MALPPCDDSLPADMNALIAEFGRLWATSNSRPRPTREVALHWCRLLQDWTEADDLPLLVRKHKDNRGSVIIHASGRRLIPTDNSPAHWSFTLACQGERPSLDDIREWLADDAIPVVMIQKSVEKPKATHHRNLKREFNVNESGWKLGHIKPVGLNSRVRLEELPIGKLEDSFRRLMSPLNLFVVPLAWAGLAEVRSVIEAIEAHDACDRDLKPATSS